MSAVAAVLGGGGEEETMTKEVTLVSEQQDALVTVITALARQRPLVLCVEDRQTLVHEPYQVHQQHVV